MVDGSFKELLTKALGSVVPSKVRDQVVLAFGFLIANFLVLAVVAALGVAELGRVTSRIYTHPLQVSNAALRASQSVDKMHKGMKDLVLAEADAAIYQALGAVEEEEGAVFRELDLVRDQILGEEGKDLERQARQLFKNWRPIRARVVILAESGKRAEAAAITRGRGADHVARLENAMHGLHDYARKKADGFMEEARTGQWRAVRNTTVVVVIGIIVSVLVATFTVKHIVTVMSERDKLIHELEAKNAELERFNYTVSHDLSSPLITIRGFAGMLRADMARGDDEAVERDLRHIEAAAATMKILIDELLELSRIGRVVNPPELVPLGTIVETVLGLLASAIEGGGVEVKVTPDLPPVWGDERRIVEVVQNLVENAIKFMGSQSEPCVEIGAREENGEVVCYVKDNGVGIEARYHAKVFELFERLETGVDGTGIGLTLVKRIVETHGGRTWIESAGDGRGATFRFSLPTKGMATHVA